MSGTGAAEPTGPAVGDAAPGFESRNQHGQAVGLHDLLGAPALLVFFPFAFSSICTGEFRELREQEQRFADLGIRVLGISCDAMFTQRAYAEAEGLTFDLLTDHWPHGAIARAYGVFDAENVHALRGSFLLDADGVVRWKVVNERTQARDLNDLLAEVAKLLPE